MVQHQNDHSKMHSPPHQPPAAALRRPFYCLFSLATVALILLLRYAALLSAPATTATTDSSILDPPTLLTLAGTLAGESHLRREITLLLAGNLHNLSRSAPFLLWRRSSLPLDLHSPSFKHLHSKFRPLLSDWSDRRRTKHHRSPSKTLTNVLTLIGRKEKYSSCAVVGNSGILLNAGHGAAIDGHHAVIRLNNARIAGFSHHVGTKTTLSFINSNILHLCHRRRACSCHPYGAAVPAVLYICQPIHFLDLAACNTTNHAPFLVTDPGFDLLCSKIVKYYSLKRWFAGGRNRSLEGWGTVHEGAMFHYSSGMQAVVMAVGVCERVSLFGFGKAVRAKHHYHTNQKAELGLHDYEAEYDFYRDLVERPERIPFLSGGEVEFPPVEIYR